MLITISVLSRPETADLAIFENRPISIKRKYIRMIRKKYNSSEVKLDGTPEAENSYLGYSICANYDFGALEAWNGLFGDFQKSADLDKEKKT